MLLAEIQGKLKGTFACAACGSSDGVRLEVQLAFVRIFALRCLRRVVLVVASALCGDIAVKTTDPFRHPVLGRLELVGRVPHDIARWVEGEFSESGKFGKGGRWHARRVPLVELLDEERIRSLVTDPLRKKYAEVFAAGR